MAVTEMSVSNTVFRYTSRRLKPNNQTFTPLGSGEVNDARGKSNQDSRVALQKDCFGTEPARALVLRLESLCELRLVALLWVG
jgi:hypothetical protein